MRIIRCGFPGKWVARFATLGAQRKGLGVVVSLQLGTGGLTKLGLMLPQPSTELVLRLWDASALGDTNNLAIFEACLGAGGPVYAEPQLLAGGWGVELHYAVE